MDENSQVGRYGQGKIYFFRQIKVGTSVKPLFHLILIEKPISYIIFMIQGHRQCQKVNLKVK